MRYTHMLTIAALVVAAAFISTQALAQWSDGGPERFPLTYPPETVVVERDSSVADGAVTVVRTFEALTQWSDGGPERFPLTYPAETMMVEADSTGTQMQCIANDRASEALTQWSDGGPERFALTYPPTESEICLAKQPEGPSDRTSDWLAMR